MGKKFSDACWNESSFYNNEIYEADNIIVIM